MGCRWQIDPGPHEDPDPPLAYGGPYMASSAEASRHGIPGWPGFATVGPLDMGDQFVAVIVAPFHGPT